jgi:hypothetical protein
MNAKTAFLTLALLVPLHVIADPPATAISNVQQANRDNEKLTILQNEYTEQRQLAADLQQQRAVALQGGNNEALAKTEERLEEVNANIAQIQQEINLAKGQPVALTPVSVRVKPVQETEGNIHTAKEAENQNAQSGQWWDLYNKNRKK